MKFTFTFLLMLVGCAVINAQSGPSQAQPEGQVPSTKSKLYYRGTNAVYIQINTENRGWKIYTLKPGTWYIDLNNCAKGSEPCDKKIKVCSGRDFHSCSNTVSLKGKKRYQISNGNSSLSIIQF